MRVGLIVDSACDLPYSFTRDNGIFILPVTARIDGQTFVDDHDPGKTRSFYRSGLLEKGHEAETEAFSVDQIYELFMKDIVPQYDVAFCETVTRSRSLIYDNASNAMQRVMADYRPVRRKHNLNEFFSMRVVDSRSIFAGQGLLAAQTLNLIKQGLSKNVLRQQVDDFTNSIYNCVIPRDLYYIRARARRRGDKSVSSVAAFLGKTVNLTPMIWAQGPDGHPVVKALSFEKAAERMIDYAVNRIDAGLLSPYVSLSYGVPEEEMESLPGLDRLRAACERNGVELLMSQMGITSSIYVGPGSVCLALAAEPHEYKDYA
ncbi:DegV family protein [Marinobacteraceae bacterium S3BR75-40.1]